MTAEIEVMTFEELCGCIKAQYGDILPENAYDSPESLSQALKDIEEDKGYRHRYNVTAFLILQACMRMPKLIFTVADIAEYSGLDKQRVSDCIKRWIKYDFRYLTRLPKRRGIGGAYSYKIRKHAIETYISLKKRIVKGFDLNRMQRTPKRTDCYFYITDVGKAKGITEADLPQIVIE